MKEIKKAKEAALEAERLKKLKAKKKKVDPKKSKFGSKANTPSHKLTTKAKSSMPTSNQISK